MTSAAGCISIAEEALRTMLADSATFRTLVGAANQAQALDDIYTDGLPEPADGEALTLAELEGYRPYSVIFTAEENGVNRELEAGGDALWYDQTGQIRLRLEQDCPTGLDDQPSSWSNQQWRITIGNITRELRDLAAKPNEADYLAIRQITVAEGPYWSDPNLAETQGNFQGVELLVTY